MPGATRLLVILSSPLPLLRHTSRHHHRLCPKLLLPCISLNNHHRRRLHVARCLSPGSKTLLPIKSSHQFHAQSSSTVLDCSYSYPDSYPFPAWYELLNNLSSLGYFKQQSFEAIRGSVADEFVAVNDIPDDFLNAAAACLAFARDRPFILGSLPARDVQVLVENGEAFLFRNGEDSVRKLRAYLSSGNTSGLDINRAQTVDLMRIILSYVSKPILSSEKHFDRELVVPSIQNLLTELTKQSHNVPESNSHVPVQNKFPDRHMQSPRHFGQNIEMKRGDWICPRCSFMNFARNMKCLECEEARPKRQLTGGEWECPQCNFFNYGRNTVCLRCDCKRPGEVSHDTNFTVGLGHSDSKKADDIERRLAANEEKAQRWFSKISQLDSTSDISSAIDDEDFPEIMPLRKGVNRFVVSTRKTPLERRLANAQYRRSLGNDGLPDINTQTGARNNNQESKISRNLEEILGSRPNVSESVIKSSPASSSISPRLGDLIVSTSNPSIPLPPDMSSKNLENSNPENDRKGIAAGSTESGFLRESLHNSENSVKKMDNKDAEGEQDEKSEGWLEKVAEVHGVQNLYGEFSGGENPESMPLRKGDNRFVVGKQKDRSLTSPLYKRRLAMEQSGNANFVPFVPFPPDYFARKQNQQHDGTDYCNKSNDETSKFTMPKKPLENFNYAGPGIKEGNRLQHIENQQRLGVVHGGQCEGSYSENKTDLSCDTQPTGSSSQDFSPGVNNSQWNGQQLLENPNDRRDSVGNSTKPSENQNIQGRWTGKSLEGSAVKEPDPLDMSEEAKAERWFRRVAQIKDISELSQIPDEDFPSIMPMRKGVNRFVVSKRKTPLERRLTSSQYRRNLPVLSSDPIKKEEENS